MSHTPEPIYDRLYNIFVREDSIMSPNDAGILADCVFKEIPEFAAALEMLEALQAIADNFFGSSENNSVQILVRDLEKVRRAIAKATGQEVTS